MPTEKKPTTPLQVERSTVTKLVINGAPRLDPITVFLEDFGRRDCTSLANPCAGVKGNKESGRDIYVEDEMLAMVYLHADQPLKDALDLFYLTGQRIADTLKMDERDIKENRLAVTQGKTSAKRRIEVVGELKVVIDRILARKASHKIRSSKLIVMDNGQPMTSSMLRGRFDAAREAAGVKKADFQMRGLRAKAGTDKAESS